MIECGDKKFWPDDALKIFQRSKEWLAEQLDIPFDGKTVVVTHHAPHWNSVHEKYRGGRSLINASFVSDLTDLMGKADLWIHGHTHASCDYRVSGTRVIGNPRGYPLGHVSYENSAFDKCMVVEV